MSRARHLVRPATAATLAATAALALPASARACSACSLLLNEKNRLAFIGTTVLLSLLPLGLLAWGLVWIARRGRDAMRDEFSERDEAGSRPASENERGSTG
jgi:hypothetical protein